MKGQFRKRFKHQKRKVVSKKESKLQRKFVILRRVSAVEDGHRFSRCSSPMTHLQISTDGVETIAIPADSILDLEPHQIYPEITGVRVKRQSIRDLCNCFLVEGSLVNVVGLLNGGVA